MCGKRPGAPLDEQDRVEVQAADCAGPCRRTAQRASKYSFRCASSGASGGKLLQPLADLPQRLHVRHRPATPRRRRSSAKLQPPLDDLLDRIPRPALPQFILPEPIGLDLRGGDHRGCGLQRADAKEEEHSGQTCGSVACSHGGHLEGGFWHGGMRTLAFAPGPCSLYYRGNGVNRYWCRSYVLLTLRVRPEVRLRPCPALSRSERNTVFLTLEREAGKTVAALPGPLRSERNTVFLTLEREVLAGLTWSVKSTTVIVSAVLGRYGSRCGRSPRVVAGLRPSHIAALKVSQACAVVAGLPALWPVSDRATLPR